MLFLWVNANERRIFNAAAHAGGSYFIRKRLERHHIKRYYSYESTSFFVFWAFAMRWSVDWNGVKIYGRLVPIGLVIAAGLYRTRGWLLRLHLLSVGLLIGSISFFLKETVRMMPHLLWLGSKLSDGILFGDLTAVLLRTP
ncbi:hypothetical protein LJK88_30545 [Paenibacillus sp. P26]|nr:hypothetical protein LJK88_30545 [Paenibacillus sp. P26]